MYIDDTKIAKDNNRELHNSGGNAFLVRIVMIDISQDLVYVEAYEKNFLIVVLILK